MEKIVASKRIKQQDFLAKKNKKIKNNNHNQKLSKIKNNIKNISKTIKNSQFFNVFCKNYVNFIVLFAFLILTIVLCLITFLHSEFYVFMARPKVLKSPVVVIFLVLFLAVSIFAFYVLNVFYQNKICLKKEDDKTESIKGPKVKNKKAKFFKKEIFKYIFLFCLLCLLFLFFSIKVLSFCVVISFLVLVDCLLFAVSSKPLWQRLFMVAVLLDALCLFLSFYFVFLLN